MSSPEVCEAARGLTTIRRKYVSPISAFPQGGRWIKGKHGFFIIRTGGSEQAEIPRPNPAVNAPPSLQSANRGSLYRLIRRYILFHGKRHPRDLGESDIAKFLSSLAVEGHVAASTQNQALNALLFLYKEVLRRQIGFIGETIRAKRQAKLPVVLSRAEVKSILEKLLEQYRLMGQLLYGIGLRLLECLRLRVKDVDLQYLHITVREPKGGGNARSCCQ